MMSYIFENLYLGDLDDACNTSDLREKKYITHILTVDWWVILSSYGHLINSNITW